jgi:hypothetical protein
VNLWSPRRIVDDIWRASRPDVPADQYLVDPLPLSPLIRAWWFTILANNVLLVLLHLRSPRIDVTLDVLKTNAVYSTLSTLLIIAAGIPLIKVVRQITEWQSTPRVTPEELTYQQAPTD